MKKPGEKMFGIERIHDGRRRVITRREMDLLISAVKAEMQMIEDHATRVGMNKHLQERHNELYGLMLALKDVRVAGVFDRPAGGEMKKPGVVEIVAQDIGVSVEIDSWDLAVVSILIDNEIRGLERTNETMRNSRHLERLCELHEKLEIFFRQD